jgi:hypothetical protein
MYQFLYIYHIMNAIYDKNKTYKKYFCQKM